MKQNYDIKVNPPKISSEEIGKHKNFDALLAKFNEGVGNDEQVAGNSSSGGSNFFLKYAVGGGLAIAASIALVLMIRGLFFSTEQIQNVLALDEPFDNIKEKFSDYSVDAEKGDTLQHSSGSLIIVPAAAFVDKSGNPVSGKVDIQYREFGDPVDMFLAGVPQSAQGQVLQSAAVMHIQGFKDGEPVFIGKDKALQVEMKSAVPADLPIQELKAYAYTAGAKDWQQKGNVKVEIIENIGQTTDSTATVGVETDRAKMIAQIEKRIAMPNKPLVPSNGIPRHMTPVSIELNAKDFPELAQYENVEWVAEKSVVDPLPESGWSDIQITRLSDMKYEAVMVPDSEARKQGRKEARYEIIPLIPYTQKTKAEYDKAMLVYNEALKQRETQVKKEIAAWENEKGHSSDNQNSKAATTAEMLQIISRFAVQEFGIWNAANPYNMNELASVNAEFTNAEGHKVTVERIFVADQKRHIYYSVQAGEKLPFDNKDGQVQLWAMGSNGQLLVAEPNKEHNGAAVTFKLKSAANIASEPDLRSVLLM